MVREPEEGNGRGNLLETFKKDGSSCPELNMFIINARVPVWRLGGEAPPHSHLVRM